MVPPSVLALPDGADTLARVLELVQADPVAIIDIAAEIAEERGAWPVDAVTQAAHDESASILEADRVRVRDAIGRMLMGRDVDQALEWLQQVGVLPRLFPELSATVDLVQESGRQHKDVWAHTKQVVRQAVRRPRAQWLPFPALTSWPGGWRTLLRLWARSSRPGSFAARPVVAPGHWVFCPGQPFPSLLLCPTGKRRWRAGVGRG